MKHPFAAITTAALLVNLLVSNSRAAEPFVPNYDEAKIPPYTLPDPLVFSSGRPVGTAREWKNKRRPEILRLFEENVYGRLPDKPRRMTWEVTSTDKMALGGKATRKEVSLYFDGRKDGPKMDLLIYLPNGVKTPAPVFLGLNFRGNQTISPDPGIAINTGWNPGNASEGIVNNRATEASRGKLASRWATALILDRGYALATAYCGDLEPDHAEGWKTGIRSTLASVQGKQTLMTNESSAMSAWAWGLSRAVDYFAKDRDIDERRVAVMGHSLLGKAALWAGACDERFAIVISNESGCGGAALSKRIYGETVGRINNSFPHWFNATFKTYNDREGALPVDQHMLLALMAPRPLYVASAEGDQWADPRGEFLSAKHTGPVYQLLGKEGVGVAEMPGVNQPVGRTVGYHMRSGKHDVTDYDWEQYLNFADRHGLRK